MSYVKIYDAGELSPLTDVVLLSEHNKALFEREKFISKQAKRIAELEEQCTKYQAELMNNDPALNPTISILETTQKWNSVKKGVPTHNRAVAIFPPFKGCEFACYNEFECCWDTEDGDDYLCDLDKVEKWFEIPLPPTTEDSSATEKEK